MIKTATPSVQQDASTEKSGYSKDVESSTRQSGSKELTVKQSPSAKDQGVVIEQYTTQATISPSYSQLLQELEEKKNLLQVWEEKLNEYMRDPNNADKVVNYLTSLQYLRNKVSELSSQLGIMSVSSNGFSFQDNQSVLQSSSVRRKDKEALRDINRPKNDNNPR